MSKFVRRALAILVATMMLLPAAALATSGVEIPVGDKQIGYNQRGDFSIMGAGDIAFVTIAPTQSGIMVYPNAIVGFEGTAPIYYTISLQHRVNGVWQSYLEVSGSGLYTTAATINPGFTVTSGETYRFIVLAFSATSYTLTGNSFIAR